MRVTSTFTCATCTCTSLFDLRVKHEINASGERNRVLEISTRHRLVPSSNFVQVSGSRESKKYRFEFNSSKMKWTPAGEVLYLAPLPFAYVLNIVCLMGA